MERAWSSTRRPALVNCTPPRSRHISGTLSSASRPAIAWLIADWLTDNACAALVKLPVSAMATSAVIW
jgi:hypothetical protein